jgi:SAM-dependent methyltransferase
MRKIWLKTLVCPNSGQGPLEAFAVELRRDGDTLLGVSEQMMEDGDEIVTGVLIARHSLTAYPVEGAVATLLSDPDVDTEHQLGVLRALHADCPGPFQQIIDATVARLVNQAKTAEGEWNRREMAYYDSPVRTAEQREQAAADIRNRPVWNIYLPRRGHIVSYLKPVLQGKALLEVGCGSARSIYWLFRPKDHNYRYVGLDISLSKLQVAKSVLPEGDFFQASALKLPFEPESFEAVLAFGSLHHLPDPVIGIENCLERIAPGGYFGCHEPIHGPKLLADGSWLKRVLEKWLVGYEHSDQDHDIDFEALLTQLSGRDYRVLSQAYSNSVLRPILNKICEAASRPNLKERLYRLTISIDRLALNSVCRLSRRLGPRGAILLAKHEPAESSRTIV